MGCGSGRNQAAKQSSESSRFSLLRLIEQYRRLVELLKTSKDPIVLAVAAHDVGQYIKYGGDKAKQCAGVSFAVRKLEADWDSSLGR